MLFNTSPIILLLTWLYGIFIDFEYVCDSKKIRGIYDAMQEMEVQMKLIRLVDVALTGIYYKITLDGSV